ARGAGPGDGARPGRRRAPAPGAHYRQAPALRHGGVCRLLRPAVPQAALPRRGADAGNPGERQRQPSGVPAPEGRGRRTPSAAPQGEKTVPAGPGEVAALPRRAAAGGAATLPGVVVPVATIRGRGRVHRLAEDTPADSNGGLSEIRGPVQSSPQDDGWGKRGG